MKKVAASALAERAVKLLLFPSTLSSSVVHGQGAHTVCVLQYLGKWENADTVQISNIT
jgi:hypothetical protein